MIVERYIVRILGLGGLGLGSKVLVAWRTRDGESEDTGYRRGIRSIVYIYLQSYPSHGYTYRLKSLFAYISLKYTRPHHVMLGPAFSINIQVYTQ